MLRTLDWGICANNYCILCQHNDRLSNNNTPPILLHNSATPTTCCWWSLMGKQSMFLVLNPVFSSIFLKNWGCLYASLMLTSFPVSATWPAIPWPTLTLIVSLCRTKAVTGYVTLCCDVIGQAYLTRQVTVKDCCYQLLALFVQQKQGAPESSEYRFIYVLLLVIRGEADDGTGGTCPPPDTLILNHKLHSWF